MNADVVALERRVEILHSIETLKRGGPFNLVIAGFANKTTKDYI